MSTARPPTARAALARKVLLAAMVFHLVFCAARIPHSVLARRWHEVAEFQREGDARYLLQHNFPDDAARQAAALVEWVRRSTPPESVVLYDHAGRLMEFVPALLYPRWLHRATGVDAARTTLLGRPLARGSLPGKGSGIIVLDEQGEHLAAEAPVNALVSELGWRLARGAVLGLAAFALLAHLLWRLGLPVPAWTMPACLVGALGTALRARRTTRPATRPAMRPAMRPVTHHASAEQDAGTERWLAAVGLLMLALALVGVTYGALATADRFWDGAVAWSLKARWLATSPALAQPVFENPEVYSHTRDYPLLQPLVLGSAMHWLGPRGARVLFPLCHVLLIALAALATRRAGAGTRWSWVVALALGTMPMLMSPTSGGVDSGYAELLLTTLLTAVGAALWLEDAWLLAAATLCLPLVKDEGLVYGALVCSTTWLVGGRRLHAAANVAFALALALWLPLKAVLANPGTAGLSRGGVVLLELGLGAALAVALLGKEWALRRWWSIRAKAIALIGAALACGLAVALLHDVLGGLGGVFASGYLAHLGQLGKQLDRLPSVLLGYAQTLVFVRMFGLTFPLLIVVALLGRRIRGAAPCRALATLLLLALPVPIMPFLLAPQDDLAHHVRSSMDRLCLHWVGIAWLLLAPWIARVLQASRQPPAASGCDLNTCPPEPDPIWPIE